MEVFQQELAYIFNAFVGIFVIVDPFAVIPVYISLTKDFPLAQEQAHVRRKATLIAWVILITFALSGMAIFKVFGITLPAFQIAGGILLLKFGLAQLSDSRDRVNPEEKRESKDRDDISVFPLAIPLLAGPGSISTVVLYSSKAHGEIRMISLVVAITAALLSCLVILKMARYLYRYLGKTGLNLMTKLMGILLTAIAVQFIINGLKQVVDTFL